MIELCDNKPQKVLDKHAVVYEHLININEQRWFTIFGKLDGAKRAMIFCDAFNELIQMAQGKYLDDYYERIRNNAV